MKSKCYNPCIIPPLPKPPTPPVNNDLKTIAFIQIDDSSYPPDQVIYESIFDYWYQDENIPRFPIIDTDGSVSNNLFLLEKYYQEGYRIFLGFTRSTVLQGVLKWFEDHPDAVGISLRSKSEDLAIPKNIYRMSPMNINIIPVILPALESANTVYYIYTKGEVATEEFLINLQALQTEGKINELKSYAVTTSNLTVANLQTFLSGSTSNDVIVVYLFNENPYFDLYSQGLTFAGDQYDILADQPPSITGPAQIELNKKLHYILNIYPNTSELWRMNSQYLSSKINNDSLIYNSGNLLNALIMIQSFQKRKNIKNLGSHSGVLEFNEFKDIIYPSYLTLLYDGIANLYLKESLFFNDPLLGKFNANFIP